MKASSNIRCAFFDIETRGTEPAFALQPWRVEQCKARITSIAMEYLARPGDNSPTQVAYLDPTVAQISEILTIIEENDLYAVGWNTIFDLSFLMAIPELRPQLMRLRFLDGMLLTMHAENTPKYLAVNKYGLKDQTAQKIPELAGYEQGVSFDDDSEEGEQLLLQYNKQDVAVTARLTQDVLDSLTDEQLRVALLEAEAIPMMAAANLRGIVIDMQAINASEQHLESLIQKLLDVLSEWGITTKTVNSNKELARLLFECWGHPIQDRTPKGAPSTGKNVLARLAKVDEKVRQVRELREALGLKKKYISNTKNAVTYNEDGKIHPLIRPFATYTGRASYASQVKAGSGKAAQVGMALHQIKRGNEFRKPFMAPPGYAFIECDAASQEYRFMSILSQDVNMLARCAPGEDPHSYMGAVIAGIPYEQLRDDFKHEREGAKAKRNLGKLANLSLQYRTAAARLMDVALASYNVPLTLAEAQEIINAYHKAYPGVRRYWDRSICDARRNGFVQNIAGRRVNLTTSFSAWEGPNRWKLESTALNFPIQSIGADQKYLALATLRPQMKSLGIRFSHDLHDGLFFLARESRAVETARKVRDILDNLDYKSAWNFEPPIPLTWDAKVGVNWGSLEDI